MAMPELCLFAPFFQFDFVVLCAPGERGYWGKHMRKIMLALSCLLCCGSVLAKETATPAHHGADSILMTTAFDASHADRAAPIRLDGTMEAAQKKKNAAHAKVPAAAPVTLAPDSKRFNMTQNGQHMTADDFDAWMKKNGYHVATGAAGKAKEEEPQKGAKK
jgi:hypothetical protein